MQIISMKGNGAMTSKTKFYKEFEPMECLQGDTLPEIYVSVEDAENCSMCAILENPAIPGSVVLSKTCSIKAASDDSEGHTVTIFAVQITSEDTKSLVGTYRLTFWLTDENNRTYVKLTGTLTVSQVAQKGESA